ncbi:hypothetical protein [Streptomyces monashensis]|uniref:Uncharacterized protein n=1 Tax=Streptomyces monashensis TaxID=1678012 RepID=A0A1S2Q7C4_9ACTN|nr:hypothetical protein [Streptomyces monashensis]OIK01653.1 hypothetical protein BIV23_25875 [Streptomyces monashensis]
MFVAVERLGLHWTLKADALTAPQHAIDAPVYDAVRTAVIHLIRSREIRPDSCAGPVYFVLYDVESEQRARELAAALHAALYEHLAPLTHAIPATPTWPQSHPRRGRCCPRGRPQSRR